GAPARIAPAPAGRAPAATGRDGGGAVRRRRSFTAPPRRHRTVALHVPKYSAYFCLISSIAFSCATGSAVSTLILESGTRSAGSLTSGWKERRKPLSTRYCWPSLEKRKLMNSRPALGCGASFMTAALPPTKGVPSLG